VIDFSPEAACCEEKGLYTRSGRIDLVDFAERYGESYFQHVADYARKWMPDFMSTQYATFDTMQIPIDLTSSKIAFLENVKQFATQLSVAGDSFKISKKRGDPLLRAYTSKSDEESISEKIPSEEIKERLIQQVARVLRESLNTEECKAELLKYFDKDNIEIAGNGDILSFLRKGTALGRQTAYQKWKKR